MSFLEAVIAEVKQRKETLAANGVNDMPPCVAAKRGLMVAMVGSPIVDRDINIVAMHALVAGMNATEVVFVSDARMARSTNNPVTGQPWRPHEMETLGVEGETQEVIVLVHGQRDSDAIGGTHLPYDVVDRQVHWLDPPEGVSGMDGLVADAVRAAWTITPLAEQPTLLDFDPPSGTTHQEALDGMLDRVVDVAIDSHLRKLRSRN